MKLNKNQKGFTLIELLIVITIIGILAVAFLPSILGAPSRARDTQRIAALNDIQQALIDFDLRNGLGYPAPTGDVAAATATGFVAPNDTWGGAFTNALGGTIPLDPDGTTTYEYLESPGGFSFGLYSDNIENFEQANANCTATSPADGTITPKTDPAPAGESWCYVILAQ